MCGIAGFVSNEKDNNINLKTLGENFLKILDHRGPDDNGIWESNCNKVCFGHNRLSIIDLTNRASQPFVSIDEKYTIYPFTI